MTASYSYNILTHIPGGLVTSNTIVRLTKLCRLTITTSLEHIEVIDGIVSLKFTTALTSMEKTTLDGDTNPAGGLIEQCADYIEILVNATPKSDFSSIHNTSDGFSSTDILLQRKKGNGTNRLGTSEAIEIEMYGPLYLNRTSGNFDPVNGQFIFKLMPSKDRTRGFFSLMIVTEALPLRVISVHLDTAPD